MKRTLRDLIMAYIQSLPSTIWYHSYGDNTNWNWEDDTEVFDRTLKTEDKLIEAINSHVKDTKEFQESTVKDLNETSKMLEDVCLDLEAASAEVDRLKNLSFKEFIFNKIRRLIG